MGDRRPEPQADTPLVSERIEEALEAMEAMEAMERLWAQASMSSLDCASSFLSLE